MGNSELAENPTLPAVRPAVADIHWARGSRKWRFHANRRTPAQDYKSLSRFSLPIFLGEESMVKASLLP